MLCSQVETIFGGIPCLIIWKFFLSLLCHLLYPSFQTEMSTNNELEIFCTMPWAPISFHPWLLPCCDNDKIHYSMASEIIVDIWSSMFRSKIRRASGMSQYIPYFCMLLFWHWCDSTAETSWNSLLKTLKNVSETHFNHILSISSLQTLGSRLRSYHSLIESKLWQNRVSAPQILHRDETRDTVLKPAHTV